jgi:hypothetical protein
MSNPNATVKPGDASTEVLDKCSCCSQSTRPVHTVGAPRDSVASGQNCSNLRDRVDIEDRSEHERTGFCRKLGHTFRWLPGYIWQRLTRPSSFSGSTQLIIALADHFEPAILPYTNGKRATRDVQEKRLVHWCREYPKTVRDWPDSDGRPFRHTYFYPAEQFDKGLIDCLVEHCKEGWGEIEIHLHHGTAVPDTAENTRRQLVEFRDALASRGCMSQEKGQGSPRYAFVHGNSTLANSGNGVACGVDDEMRILSETGCYADFTLPSAPNPSQVAKINSLYECALPLDRRSPHRSGRDLESGYAPKIFPLIIQGPLMVTFARRKNGWRLPSIENGALTTLCPPTLQRLKLWKKAAVTVHGRPDWLFIKLSCHGMDPNDGDAMLGSSIQRFLKDLAQEVRGGQFQVHFVTAREMVNIILAACDGHEGNPRDYRDYRLALLEPRPTLPSGHLQCSTAVERGL